jgi:hypothetical protein
VIRANIGRNFKYMYWGLLCATIPKQGATVTYLDTLKRVSTTVATSALTISLDGVPIMWQQKDLLLTSTATSDRPSFVTVIATTTVSNSPISSSGFSTSGKVGVGVGVGLGVVALLSLAGLLFVRWKRARKVPEIVYEGADGHIQEPTELKGMSDVCEISTAPTPYHNRHELSGGGAERRHELPGDVNEHPRNLPELVS